MGSRNIAIIISEVRQSELPKLTHSIFSFFCVSILIPEIHKHVVMSSLLKLRKRQILSPPPASSLSAKKQRQSIQSTLTRVQLLDDEEPSLSSPKGKGVWSGELNFGSDYKKRVVEMMMKPTVIKKEGSTGKTVHFRQCYCPRPENQCKKRRAPIIANKNAGYTNFFSHLVSMQYSIFSRNYR